jgi:glycosyltransferase involved in cell wall biosynthesis
LVVSPEKGPLAAALHEMVHDRALHNRLREGCRAVTEQLSWERLAEQMEKYYADAMDGNNGVH